MLSRSDLNFRKTGISDIDIRSARNPPPKMEHYGLPASFSVSSYQDSKVILEDRQKKATFYSMISTVCAFLALIIFIKNLAVIFIVLFFNPITWIIVYKLFEKTIPNFVRPQSWELQYKQELEAYTKAVNEWRDRATEGGIGYWRELKGISFETAVAAFFRRRGCSATLTKITGDGGIDIVLAIGAKQYWCQCKGHANPIPVGEIRRIAGATLKSKGTAYPVIFATNGYTKAALNEAKELEVICIDATDLTRHSHFSQINRL